MIEKTGYHIDVIMNLPYPLFADMFNYYANPEEYFEGKLTSKEISEKKAHLHDKLERLRSGD